MRSRARLDASADVKKNKAMEAYSDPANAEAKKKVECYADPENTEAKVEWYADPENAEAKKKVEWYADPEHGEAKRPDLQPDAVASDDVIKALWTAP